MKLYAHLSVDAAEEQTYVRDRSDLDATIVSIGRDRYDSNTSIHVYGPPANRAAFLRSWAVALTAAAVELEPVEVSA